jgi:hypothetical protein
MQMIGMTVLVFVLACGALGTGGNSSWWDEATRAPGRNVKELREDSESLIKKSKDVVDPAQFTAAILDLCCLHREIVAHEKFGTHPQLDSVRARIGIRLKAIAKELKRDLSDGADSGEPNVLRSNGSDEIVSRGDQVRAEGSVTANYATSRRDGNTREINHLGVEQAYFADCLVGGPLQYLAYLPGSFAPPWDHGQDLVNLIETTIHPDFWVRNGGNGVIHYYQPLRILVVSGTTQVHDEMTDLLRRMRTLSR